MHQEELDLMGIRAALVFLPVLGPSDQQRVGDPVGRVLSFHPHRVYRPVVESMSFAARTGRRGLGR